MKREKRSYAVIGLGSFGHTIATTLFGYGDHVLGIDIDSAKVNRYADQMTQTVTADATDERALQETGIADFDQVVIAMASSLEASLLAAVNIQQLSEASVWAKAQSAQQARILSAIGVNRILQPEFSFGRQIAINLHNPALLAHSRLGDKQHFGQLLIGEKMNDKPFDATKLEESYDLNCLGVMRGNEILPPNRITKLKEGDQLLLVGSQPALSYFADRV